MIFQKEFTKNFTMVHNEYLRDKNLSLAGKGILTVMLSLPKTWNFSIKGLAAYTGQGEKAISTALKACEKAGYLVRERVVDVLTGRVVDWEYHYSDNLLSDEIKQKAYKSWAINEKLSNKIKSLFSSKQNNTKADNPLTAGGNVVVADVGTEANQEYKKEKTCLLNPQSIRDKMEEIKTRISYDYLCDVFNRERVDELVQIMTDAETSTAEYLRIAQQNVSVESVRTRFSMIKDPHIEYVFACIDSITTPIRNIRSYILTCLYNAPSSIATYYSHEARVLLV